MTIYEFILFAVILYYVIYVLLWLFLDCNVALRFKESFGSPISVLRGQVVWITGASSGIGRALAISLARHGAVRLVLSARREALLEEVYEECLREANGLLSPKDILVLQMDMLDLKKHEECFEQVLSHFGRLDILVNNAGRSQRANWEDISVQVDRELFELDVFSVMHLSRIVVRYFIRQCGGRGHLAATSSIAGFGIVPFSATYCAAKHALNSYFSCLKIEQPTLDISLFAPGPVATDFLEEAFTATPHEKVGQSTKNQKRMTAERCGYLFAVALANKMDLSWCGLFPVNFLGYVAQSVTLSKLVFHMMGRSAISKIREGKL